MSETTRRSFLKGLGLFTAGIAFMPEEPLRRLWALGAPLEETASGITVFKSACWIQVSNELLEDSAFAADQFLRQQAARWLKTTESRVLLRRSEGYHGLEVARNQTWFEAAIA